MKKHFSSFHNKIVAEFWTRLMNMNSSLTSSNTNSSFLDTIQILSKLTQSKRKLNKYPTDLVCEPTPLILVSITVTNQNEKNKMKQKNKDPEHSEFH